MKNNKKDFKNMLRNKEIRKHLSNYETGVKISNQTVFINNITYYEEGNLALIIAHNIDNYIIFDLKSFKESIKKKNIQVIKKRKVKK
jgi:uncharacterized protein YbcC (UPF0753/DUF2309 family)